MLFQFHMFVWFGISYIAGQIVIIWALSTGHAAILVHPLVLITLWSNYLATVAVLVLLCIGIYKCIVWMWNLAWCNMCCNCCKQMVNTTEDICCRTHTESPLEFIDVQEINVTTR
jgi:hypothetical protein